MQDLNSIKLHISGTQVDRYVALSHCWGKSKPFTTTKSTLPQRMSGFQLSEIPKTFSHAIFTTHLLGIRYLWIDSLCIVQDDPSDWRRESATMGDVYSNAYFTIAAGNAPEDTQGFLMLRGHNIVTLKINSASGDSADVLLQSNAWLRPGLSMEKTPLYRRAWTLQEQYLSPRIITFYDFMTSWRCGDTFLYDTMEQGFGALNNPNYMVEQASKWPWAALIIHFCYRDITFETDTFHALAGLAAHFSKIKQSQYCAGLWYNEMPKCLLWSPTEATGGQIRGKPHTKYVELSWSWAALKLDASFKYSFSDRGTKLENNVDGEKGFPNTPTVSSFRLIECYTPTAGESPFGAVEEGAYLSLEVSLVPVKLKRPGILRLVPKKYYSVR